MKLSVGMKVGGGFAIVLLLLLSLAGLAVYTLNGVDADIRDIEMRAGRLILDNGMEAEFQDAALAIRGYLGYGDEQYVEDYHGHIAAMLELMAQRSENATEQARAQVEEMRAWVQDYDTQITTRMFPLIKEGRTQEAADVGTTLVPITDKINATLEEFTARNEGLQFELMAAIDADTDRSRVFTLAVSGAALLLGLILAFFVTRSITGPVGIISEGVRRLAEGDFTQDAVVKARDEIGQLAGDANRMREQLRELIGNGGVHLPGPGLPQ